MPTRCLSLLLVSMLAWPAATSSGSEPGSANCFLVGTVEVCKAHAPAASRPSVPSCTSWERYLPDGSADAPLGLYVDVRDGVEWDLFSRTCPDDALPQYRWIPQLTPLDLVDAAYDSVSKEVPEPELHMSRAIDDLIVNVATTIEVTPIEPVTATAQIPGLAATVTATATRIDVVTGSKVAGDVQQLSCEPWGGAGSSCTWTPVYPSVFKVTGTQDHRHHGSVSVVWHVAWTTTDGGGGDLGELTTTTLVEFAVREIQIIGG
jgi:hypothetical protein